MPLSVVLHFATAAGTLHYISIGAASLLHVGFNNRIHFEVRLPGKYDAAHTLMSLLMIKVLCPTPARSEVIPRERF
uniref:Uncharacterized protein n=1 Tax=Peronospora matthiolae TaxID=2874970 RepID=A0AAV1UR95_9STRA